MSKNNTNNNNNKKVKQFPSRKGNRMSSGKLPTQKTVSSGYKSSNGEEPVHAYNDASWYNRNPEALKDATSLIMNIAAGEKIWDKTDRAEISLANMSIPGVMSLEAFPTIGGTYGHKDAINLAAQRLYTKIRYENTGSANYEATDLMMYFMSMDQIFTFYAWCVRVYRTINLYNSRNRNLPELLLVAMGIDQASIADLRENMANFHFWLVNFKAQLDSFNVPAEMDIITRHYWLYSNVYKDSDTDRASLYVFKPYHNTFLKWTEDEALTKGFALYPYRLTDTTFSGIKTFGEDMIQRLRLSEDFQIMNGDVLKVWSKANCFAVSAPAVWDVIEPTYNREVLMQINNAIMVGWNDDLLDNTKNGRIVQSNLDFSITQELYTDPYVAGLKPINNYYHEDVSSDDIMVSTRLTPYVGLGYNGSTYYGKLESCGSDIIISASMYMYYYNTNGPASITVSVLSSSFDWVDGTSEIAVEAGNLEQFDYHPFMYVRRASDTPTDSKNVISILGDVDNFTILNALQLNQLHQTALFSLFNVY